MNMNKEYGQEYNKTEMLVKHRGPPTLSKLVT